jgi:hypothetical protein
MTQNSRAILPTDFTPLDNASLSHRASSRGKNRTAEKDWNGNEKVLYKHINSAVLQAAENRNWIRCLRGNDNVRLITCCGQISRLRCAALEMTPEWITAYGGLRSLPFTSISLSINLLRVNSQAQINRVCKNEFCTPYNFGKLSVNSQGRPYKWLMINDYWLILEILRPHYTECRSRYCPCTYWWVVVYSVGEYLWAVLWSMSKKKKLRQRSGELWIRNNWLWCGVELL